MIIPYIDDVLVLVLLQQIPMQEKQKLNSENNDFIVSIFLQKLKYEGRVLYIIKKASFVASL